MSGQTGTSTAPSSSSAGPGTSSVGPATAIEDERMTDNIRDTSGDQDREWTRPYYSTSDRTTDGSNQSWQQSWNREVRQRPYRTNTRSDPEDDDMWTGDWSPAEWREWNANRSWRGQDRPPPQDPPRDPYQNYRSRRTEDTQPRGGQAELGRQLE